MNFSNIVFTNIVFKFNVALKINSAENLTCQTSLDARVRCLHFFVLEEIWLEETNGNIF